ADKLATAAIIRHLIRLEERSWAEYAEGRPLTPRHLAQLLEGFRIKAKQIRQGAATRKGYLRSDFTDAFGRYLPPVPSDSGVDRRARRGAPGRGAPGGGPGKKNRQTRDHLGPFGCLGEEEERPRRIPRPPAAAASR